MNGRVYDPAIGRFLSADPIVQDPLDLQAYNRYAYVRNNPLSFTDPSGFSWLGKHSREIFSAIGAIIFPNIAAATYVADKGLKEFGRFARKNDYVAEVAQVAICAASTAAGMPGVCAYAVGAVTYGVTDGDLARSMLAGATAYAQGQFAGVIKNAGFNWAGQISAHGALGGFAAGIQGGDIRAGVMSGGAAKGVTVGLEGLGFYSADSPIGAPSDGNVIKMSARTAIVGISGGVVSRVAGGSFASGVLTGSVQHLFNAEGLAQKGQKGRGLTTDEIAEAKGVFGDKIDYSKVRIINGKYFPFQGKGYVIAPNGNIYWPGECGNLASCGGIGTAGTFIHEMTHIMQHQQGVNVLVNGFFLQAAKF